MFSNSTVDVSSEDQNLIEMKLFETHIIKWYNSSQLSLFLWAFRLMKIPYLCCVLR